MKATSVTLIQLEAITTALLFLALCVPQTEAVCQGDTVNSASSGKIIYVDCKNTEGPWDGSFEHPFKLIQQGIDAASDGDTVHVCWGVYIDAYPQNRPYINKSINFIGEEPTIDHIGTEIMIKYHFDWLIKVLADYVNVSGFFFWTVGPNLQIKMLIQASNCSIHNNVFLDEGFILTEQNIVVIDGQYNTITQNRIGGSIDVQNDSKGIHLIRSHHNVISDNLFWGGWFYGIFLENSDNNLIVNNTFISNHGAFLNSYGIVLDSSSQNTISRNSIDSFHWMVLTKSSDNQITMNYFNNSWRRNRKVEFSDCKNTWDQNYWGRPRLLPKIIIGEKTVNGKKIIAFQVDRHPAKTPNMIS